MSETLFHPDGRVDVEELPNGKRRLQVSHHQRGTAVPYNGWVTSYPVGLIQAVLAVKGPGYLCDEIRRDEGPSLFDKVLLGHFSERDFAGKRILDFGCGSGGSTVQLARVFPHSQVVGVELVQEFVELAKVRASHYGFQHVAFFTSPRETELPRDLGTFDFVTLCAVYEHLLPEERPKVLATLWSHMKPGSVLFLTDTPHRYSPIESHTTHLPFLNYLPARLALWVARKFARGVAPDESWRALLRRGIRGGSIREIMGILRRCGEGKPEVLTPTRLGLRDAVDVWYEMAEPETHTLSRRVMRRVLKAVSACTRWPVLPYLFLAIRKG